MEIGYSVEGSTDRALLHGLRDRWCPEAELIKGKIRGQTRRPREIPNIYTELKFKGADIVIFMRDANNENWREVLAAESKYCKPENQDFTIFAVCNRNVECWICADVRWIKEQLRSEDDFSIKGAKDAFEQAMQISRDDNKESEIIELVKKAPLKQWLQNRSFKDFYEKLRDKSQELGCRIENLLDN